MKKRKTVAAIAATLVVAAASVGVIISNASPASAAMSCQGHVVGGRGMVANGHHIGDIQVWWNGSENCVKVVTDPSERSHVKYIEARLTNSKGQTKVDAGAYKRYAASGQLRAPGCIKVRGVIGWKGKNWYADDNGYCRG